MSGPTRSDPSLPLELETKLAHYGQQHVLRALVELPLDRRRRFLDQLAAIDFAQINALVRLRRQSAGENADQLHRQAQRAAPPASAVRLPQTDEERRHRADARKMGEQLLVEGKVGAILVAGGQGTRLGFDKPKGMFPIGPVSHAPLFEILAQQVLARSRRARRAIPYFVMTSDATHEATVAFFREKSYFGLTPADVHFFCQGNMPAVDAETGKLLLAGPGKLSQSPDGHGGILAALKRSGMIEEMARRGVEYLDYHQVDNPTAQVCDPVFLGFHAQARSEMSTKVVRKRSADERMGVVVDVDGKTQVIEYSDLPDDVAAKRDEAGELLLWAGSTALHIFDRGFLERVAEDGSSLPFHVAFKKVPHIDERGSRVEPQKENAFKFERFIFDAMPLARRVLVLEVDRAQEFNPVKNGTGNDSPQTVEAALDALYRGWLRAAGATLEGSGPVEISPRYAVDAEELREKLSKHSRFETPLWLH